MIAAGVTINDISCYFVTVVRRPAAPESYYCDICEKKFNGPKPYSAHMVSKAHKEEVALREENPDW